MDALDTFLLAAAGKTYRLGEWDCGLWLADWYMAATGKPDPVPHHRGRDYGEHGAPRAYIIRQVARDEGLQRTSEPRRGDIGLVSVQKGHLVGAIYTGKWWCVLTERGGIAAAEPQRFRFIAAWQVA